MDLTLLPSIGGEIVAATPVHDNVFNVTVSAPSIGLNDYVVSLIMFNDTSVALLEQTLPWAHIDKLATNIALENLDMSYSFFNASDLTWIEDLGNNTYNLTEVGVIRLLYVDRLKNFTFVVEVNEVGESFVEQLNPPNIRARFDYQDLLNFDLLYVNFTNATVTRLNTTAGFFFRVDVNATLTVYGQRMFSNHVKLYL